MITPKQISDSIVNSFKMNSTSNGGWLQLESTPYKPDQHIDVVLIDGSVLMDLIPQCDGDLWWSGGGTGERFIDPQYSVTHWRYHGE